MRYDTPGDCVAPTFQIPLANRYRARLRPPVEAPEGRLIIAQRFSAGETSDTEIQSRRDG
jgi:hypothetical protein